MSIKYNFMSVIVLIMLTACGGGGGGDGEDSTGSNNQKITLATNNIIEAVFEGTANGPNSRVRVDISADIISQVSSSKPLYFNVIQTNSNAIISVEIFSSYGELVIEGRSPVVLGPGSYSTGITVIGCWDANCSDQFGSAQLTYNYYIRERPTPEQSQVNLLAEAGSETATAQVEIDFKQLGVGQSWDVSVEYDGETVDWLTLEKSTNNNIGLISLQGHDVDCGVYRAKLIVSYQGQDGLSGEVWIDVEYSSNGSAKISEIFPMLQYSNEPIRMLLVGCGFSSLDENNIELQGLTVTSAKIYNNYQLNIVAEPVTSSGEVSITLSSMPIPEEPAKILVKSTVVKEEYSPPLGAYFNQPVWHYDNFNETAHVYQASGWAIHRYQDDQWQDVSDLIDTPIQAMTQSNDGQKLYAASNTDSGTEIIEFNAASLSESARFLLPEYPYFDLGVVNSITMLNNHRIIATHKEGYISIFDPKTNSVEFENVFGSQTYNLTSGDRGVVYFAGARNSRNVTRYLPFSNEFTQFTLDFLPELTKSSISHDGERIVLYSQGFYIYSKEMEQLSAQIPARHMVISKDGSRAYAADDNKLRIYDLTNLSIDEVPSIISEQDFSPGACLISNNAFVLSGDEKNIFYFGGCVSVFQTP